VGSSEELPHSSREAFAPLALTTVILKLYTPYFRDRRNNYISKERVFQRKLFAFRRVIVEMLYLSIGI